ncbi:hypothetical protein HYW84_01850 [Candidatus Peregrinibacteria bacterium]|nr:hypothetical protein [Candidatus Peregrinibacteria bacterium]
MLQRPTFPLPRKFNRPLTRQTRIFVERRHKVARQRRSEQRRRSIRKWRATVAERMSAMRKWLKFLALALAAFVVFLLLFSPILHVREIRVIRSEGRIALPAVLQALAPLYGRHLLMISTHDAAERVKLAVPDASDVYVRKQYPSELVVRIAVSPLVARILIDPPGAVAEDRASAYDATPGVAGLSGSGAIASEATADFLTANGMLVSTVHVTVSQPMPVIRVVDWAAFPVPMHPLLTPEFMDHMKRAEEALALEFGQQIATRTVFLRAREFHLDSPKVGFWFDVRTPLEDQLQRLRIFLGKVKLQDVKSHVDLRLTGRVIYQ